MPGRDGTGPMGQGARTGRGLGNCLAYGIPVLAGAAMALGFGRRRGFGRGFGGGFGRGFMGGFGWGAPSNDNIESAAKDNELTALKEQAKLIQSRIEELENH